MFSHLAVLDFNTPELLLILAIVLLLFGGKRLPELSRSIGESLKELRKASSSAEDLHREAKAQVNSAKASISGDATENRE